MGNTDQTIPHPDVLVVEDEEVLRRLLVTTLRGEGFEVLEADDGKNGQTLALKYHPRLILLDIIMPRVNGIDMLKLLRQDEWGHDANVVLLTNLGDTDSLKRANKYQVSDYLVKSDWSLDELTMQIKQKLAV